MSLEESFVEIQPQVDPSSFESAIDGAMQQVETRAAEATSSVEQSFDEAADGADSALSGIDPDLSSVTGEAEDAGASVQQSLDEAATAADDALSGIDGDGFTAATGAADTAGDEVASAMQAGADDADAALAGVEGDFSAATAAADTAADEVAASLQAGADDADSALSDVEGDFSAATAAADTAADEVTASMGSAADEAEGALSDITGDFSQLEDDAASAATDVTDSFDGVGDAISEEMDDAADSAGDLRGQVAGLVTTLVSLAVFRQSALDAERFNSAIGATDQLLQQTGHQAGLLQSDLEAMAREAQLELGVDVTEMIEAQNILLTFGNISDRVFERTLTLSQDISTVMGTNLRRSLIQLGRAIDDPAEGMTSLTRIGVTFSTAQENMIQQLQESGQLFEAQSIILDELEAKFGGVAEATADSSAIIGSSVADLRRELGAPIIEVVDENLDAILRITESLIPAAESLGTVFGASLELLIAAEPVITTVADGIGAIPDPVLAMAAAFTVANRALRVGVPMLRRMSLLRFAGVAGSLAALTAAFELFDQGVEGVDQGVSSADQALRDLSSGVDNELINSLREGHGWLEDSVSVLDLVNVNLTTLDEGARRAANDFDDSMKSVDQALVELVSGGNIDEAQNKVQLLADELGIGGDELDAWVSENLPQYSEALVAARIEAEQTQAAIEQFGAATEEVGNVLTQFDTEPTASGFIDLARALQESEDRAADFDVAASTLGTDLETLQNDVVPGVLEEFDAFVSSMEGSMPGLADVVAGAFDRMDEEQEQLTFSEVRDSLFATLEDARQFSTDVQTLVDNGLTQMARLALEGGPEVAAALVSGPEDAQDDMEIALQELNTVMREQTLQTAADAAIVSHFVGQALRDGTLDGVEALPEDIRGVIEESVGVYVNRDPTPEVSTFAGRAETAIEQALDRTVGSTRNAFHERFPNTVEAANAFIDEKAAEYGSAAANAVQRGLAPLRGEVRTSFGVRLPDDIEDQSEEGRSAGRFVGRAAGHGVSEGINDRRGRARRAARGTVNSAASAARSRANNAGFWGIGNSIAGGVASGMGSSSALAAIINAAVRLVNSALSAARDAAGIFSPSREFRAEIGEEIPAGIAEGILNGEQDVVDATRRVLDSAAAAEASVPTLGGDGPVAGAGRDEVDASRLREFIRQNPPEFLPAGAEGGPQPQRVELVIRSDGTEEAELQVRQLQKAVRVRGGNVQEVLGSGEGV